MMNRTLPPAGADGKPSGDPDALVIENLSYAYPDGHVALRGVSLRLCAGEKVALVGPNGAGKSTLLVHLNGVVERQNGAIRVCGVELSRATVRQVRGMVGMVFQSPDDQLFSPTVFDDVAFGPIYQGLPPAEIRARVDEALRMVRMEDYRQRVSHHLSVGEKKRIAIATVLSMRPDLLVLDEPSAGLDPRARRGLIDLLRELPQTMLVATHDLALVRDLLPRTVIMDGGQVVADGPTVEILEDEGLLNRHGLEKR
jgi:cobalt/nickel transport system ATP-binding protein